MANVSNTMIITDSSLTQVSKELIDKRTYENGKITVVGNPRVVDGTATGINNSNYFTYDNFSFSDLLKSAKVTFSGNYSSSDSTQSCAWSLTDGTNNLSLYVLPNNKIQLSYNNTTLINLNGMTFTRENPLSMTVSFTNTYSEGEIVQQDCSLMVVLDEKVYSHSCTITNVNNIVDFSTFTSLFLGNNSSTDKHWQGNIHLANFALYQNNSIIYTPSLRNSFRFNKVMLGDGSIPLSDNSVPVLDHIVSININEISRTSNNILLTCTIPADAYLNIAEIALYYLDDSGVHMFSKLSGLSVAKGRDLIYNLIIHVKLDINVVNTVAVPEIIINNKEYIKYTDFLTVKQVYAYITENLERLIRLNAFGIGSYDNAAITMQKAPGVGFNRAQVLYRAENNAALCLDNCSATTMYSKLKNRFTPKTTVTFDPSRLSIEGNVLLTNEGIGSAFTEADYIKATSSYNVSSVTNWDIKVTFTTGSITNEQSILCLTDEDTINSLVLGINDGNCTLTLNNSTSSIYNDNLFPVTSSTNYSVEISYVPGLYTSICKDKDGQIIEIVTIPSGFALEETTSTYFGVMYDFENDSLTSPFNGSIDFMQTSYTSETFSPSVELIGSSKQEYKEETTTLLSLKDFFYLPDYAHHYYHVANLGYEGTSYLEVYEGAFKGYYDRTDFLTSPNGFTLCTKVDLIDANDKILLAKGNITSGSFYFILEEKDQAIIFTLYLTTGTVIMKKQLDVSNIRNYIEHPITITVTCDGNQYSPTFKMYKNNELIGTYVLPNFSNVNINNMYLMNHEHFSSDEDYLEERTVHTILNIMGVISSEDLYYINNVLDTNF